MTMDKLMLENILADQKEELESRQTRHFVHRREEDDIDLDSPLAQVVIGVRRCGKSTLCYNTLTRRKVKFAYVNFDDERLISVTYEDLNDILEVLYMIYGDFHYLFIDEIQNIGEWYLFANRLLRRGMHLVITGSNAKLLSGELATHLTGRHHTITLYPFSFAEFCEFKKVDASSQSTKAIAEKRVAFEQYLKEGGFPELQFIKDHYSYINELVANILTRDIEQRFKIRYKAAFEQLSHHLLNIAPTILSDTKLHEIFSLKSLHTVKNYINYLEQAYVLSGLYNYSPKSRFRLTGHKVYSIDVAFMNNRENAFSGDNLGYRLETIVYLELLRRYKSRGYDIYYINERSGECDFVVCRGSRTIECIQVSYDISSPKTHKREVDGLLMASQRTRCENLLLLTNHDAGEINRKGHKIRIMPVYAYALTPYQEQA